MAFLNRIFSAVISEWLFEEKTGKIEGKTGKNTFSLIKFNAMLK